MGTIAMSFLNKLEPRILKINPNPVNKMPPVPGINKLITITTDLIKRSHRKSLISFRVYVIFSVN